MKLLRAALLSAALAVPTTVAVDVATPASAEAWHYNWFGRCGNHSASYAHYSQEFGWRWVRSWTYGTSHWHLQRRWVWTTDHYGRWYWKYLGTQWYQCS